MDSRHQVRREGARGVSGGGREGGGERGSRDGGKERGRGTPTGKKEFCLFMFGVLSSDSFSFYFCHSLSPSLPPIYLSLPSSLSLSLPPFLSLSPSLPFSLSPSPSPSPSLSSAVSVDPFYEMLAARKKRISLKKKEEQP